MTKKRDLFGISPTSYSYARLLVLERLANLLFLPHLDPPLPLLLLLDGRVFTSAHQHLILLPLLLARLLCLLLDLE